jgi:hypothetical protein
MFNSAMTANLERFQALGRFAGTIRLFRQFAQLPQRRWADAQQPAHFPRAIDRPPLDIRSA